MSAGAGLDWDDLFVTYTSLGFAPAEFWGLTLREVTLLFKAAGTLQRREYNERMTQAWWSANWPWLKSPPTLKDVLAQEARQSRQITDWRAIKAALMVALA